MYAPCLIQNSGLGLLDNDHQFPQSCIITGTPIVGVRISVCCEACDLFGVREKNMRQLSRTILPDAMRAILTTTIGSLVLPVVVFSKGAIKLKLWSTVDELNRDKWEKCRGHATELTCAAVVSRVRSTET